MKGLIYTNFSLIRRVILVYMLLGVGVAVLMLNILGSEALSLSIVMVCLVIITPVWEAIKVEALSGYNKYALTLPVTRRTVIQSYYVFFFLIVMIGVILFVGILYVHELFSMISIDSSLYRSITLAILAMLTMGGIIFPLIFMLGEEKSDFILFLSLGFMALVVNLVRVGVEHLIEQSPLLKFNLDLLIHVPFIYILISILIFLLSYVTSLAIYHKKEF
ncbi:ABC-2 transporter permease [Lysinibacillus sphaericus]|uniref:ABC-2 transporter permease n=1 Tax=Lysinibacillus sphaericus TaxID=1421 RepID=UPI003D7F5182